MPTDDETMEPLDARNPEPGDSGPRAAGPERGREDLDDVRAAIAGDPDAFARLYQRWFDRVHDLAFRVVRDTATAADVAQDTFLRAYRSLDRLEEPAAFGGWLLRIARNRAYDVAARAGRTSAFDDNQLATIERAGGGTVSAPSGFAIEDRLARSSRPAEAAEDSELAALLWEAANALGERDREVLDLQLRHGLEPAEVAAVIGVNRNAANQTVHRVRQRLAAAVAARVLWRGGTPRCADLGRELDEAGVAAFGSAAVRIADRHVVECARCDEFRRVRLDPSVLFAALPMLSVPALRARVSDALAAEGVPVTTGERVPPAAEGGNGESQRLERGAQGAAGARRRRTAARALAVMLLAGLVAVTVFVVADSGDGVDVATVGESAGPVPSASEPDATAPTIAVVTATSFGLGSDTSVDPRGATSTTELAVATPTAPPTAPPTSPETTSPPTTTTAPPPTPASQLRISRSTVPLPGYSMSAASAPRITWSTANVATVTLSGPNLTKHGLDGEVTVCPGVEGGGSCTLTPSIGTVTYRLRGYDREGNLVADRSVTLTVTTP